MTFFWRLAATSLLGALLAAGWAFVRGDARAAPPEAYTGVLAQWTDGDFRELEAISKRLEANPADLLLVIMSESGLKPWAKNPLGAVGLFQLTEAAEKATGLSSSNRLDIARGVPDLRHWTVAAQLPLGERLFKAVPWVRAGRKLTHAGTLYGNLFAPGRLMARGDRPEAVLFDESDGSAYTNNAAAFDPASTGKIRVSGLIARLRKLASTELYRLALSRLNAVTGHDYSPRFAP